MCGDDYDDVVTSPAATLQCDLLHYGLGRLHGHATVTVVPHAHQPES
jgi:hypothetical protein